LFTVAVLTKDAGLTPLQIRACFKQMGYETQPAPDDKLNIVECWKFWIFLLINKLKFLDPEQKMLLFLEVSHNLVEESPLLVIADSRFASWTGRTGWLDLSNGESVEVPKHKPLETLGYDLTVLRARNVSLCTRIRDEQSSRSVDG
jgi:hypothetical protein